MNITQSKDDQFLKLRLSQEHLTVNTTLLSINWPPQVVKKEPWYFGTGFFYRVDGQDFLVTARHILSARTWRENAWRSDHQVAPNYIRIGVRGKTVDGGFNADSLPVYDIVLPLLDDDAKPLARTSDAATARGRRRSPLLG